MRKSDILHFISMRYCRYVSITSLNSLGMEYLNQNMFQEYEMRKSDIFTVIM